MTSKEKALVAALEANIATWEQEGEFFEELVQQVDMGGGNSMPGKEYAQGIRKRIADHRALIENAKRVDPFGALPPIWLNRVVRLRETIRKL